jgi:hypothetical protein
MKYRYAIKIITIIIIMYLLLYEQGLRSMELRSTQYRRPAFHYTAMAG